MIICRKTLLIQKSELNTPEQKLWTAIFNNSDKTNPNQKVFSIPKVEGAIDLFMSFTTRRI